MKQSPSLLVYDTRRDDTKNFGAGLGCNGLIHVLVEPILPEKPSQMEALQQVLDSPAAVLLCTGFDPQPLATQHAGTLPPIALARHAADVAYSVSSTFLTDGQYMEDSERELISSKIMEAAEDQRNVRCILSRQQYFLQYIPKPQRLVVLGAGNDVQLLAQQALLLGWELLLLDEREYYLRPGASLKPYTPNSSPRIPFPMRASVPKMPSC
ncbi:hypothetical protein [Nitritalea halalkaliphila]|uniref:hypothetical protein n=1 Tax=Nitritalea halalkaliphila TaxID=590849 RepID=UPI00058C42F8|nr:hypothetical protein [Nitritalea halalkaliphila]